MFVLAIGWTIADIIWIDPEIFSHKIKLEVDNVHNVEFQRVTNPPMQKVVKKDIIK